MSQEIKLCVHCEEVIRSGRYCKWCDTKEKREEMDRNNKELFESKGLIFNHNCR